MNGCMRALVDKIKEMLVDKLLVLSSPGIADIIIFKKAASKIFRIEDNDDVDIETKGVARKIVSEISEMTLESHIYEARIDVPLAKSYVSPTLANASFRNFQNWVTRLISSEHHNRKYGNKICTQTIHTSPN